MSDKEYCKKVRSKGYALGRQRHVGDDIYHCTASCYISANRGPFLVWKAGMYHEAQGLIIYDKPWAKEQIINIWRSKPVKPRGKWAFQITDLINNAIGIQCGKSENTWEGCYSCCLSSFLGSGGGW